LILIIFSYTVSKLVRFLRHSVDHITSVQYMHGNSQDGTKYYVRIKLQLSGLKIYADGFNPSAPSP